MPSTSSLNTFYLAYFILHIPTVLLVDCSALYPSHLVPPVSRSLVAYLVRTYKDQFFVSPPSFFVLFTWMEALFHIPVCIWSIWALASKAGSPKLPIVLLMYAVQTAVTTVTCLWEMLGWEVLTAGEKGKLMGLYVPYLMISVVMLVDAFSRLSRAVDAHAREEKSATGAGRAKKGL